MGPAHVLDSDRSRALKKNARYEAMLLDREIAGVILLHLEKIFAWSRSLSFFHCERRECQPIGTVRRIAGIVGIEAAGEPQQRTADVIDERGLHAIQQQSNQLRIVKHQQRIGLARGEPAGKAVAGGISFPIGVSVQKLGQSGDRSLKLAIH